MRWKLCRTEYRNSDSDLRSTPAGTLPSNDPGIEVKLISLFSQNIASRTVANLIWCQNGKKNWDV